MNQLSKSSAAWLTVLRVVTGWLMFYAGITKVLDPAWSAAGYLKSAKTFSGFYGSLADGSLLPVINFVNEWGLTLLGISLILGILVRWSSVLGAALMLLYYFPAVNFPFVEHGFLVEEHIIYAAALILIGTLDAGRYYGLEQWFRSIFKRS